MGIAVVSPASAVFQTSAVLTSELLATTPAATLAEALMRLSTAERLVLSLTYFHELDIADVAMVMRTSSEVVLAIHAAAVHHVLEFLN